MWMFYLYVRFVDSELLMRILCSHGTPRTNFLKLIQQAFVSLVRYVIHTIHAGRQQWLVNQARETFSIIVTADTGVGHYSNSYVIYIIVT